MTSAWLDCGDTGTGVRHWKLHGQAYRIGRGIEMEIRLEHPSISREHAALRRVGSTWLLQDSNSSNGLWWRSRRVRELCLRDGDRVALAPPDGGSVPELHFHQVSTRARRLQVACCIGALAVSIVGLGTLLAGLITTPLGRQLAGMRGPLLLFDRTDRPLPSPDSFRSTERRRLEAFSPSLVDALLASEDDRFWWHPGVDPTGIARALLTNLRGGRVLEGGSTITQQLARSLYPDRGVGRGDTLARKWRELLVALQLEARFSKEALLLSYLNRVYLGVGWGFEQAAQQYFARSSDALSVEEAALRSVCCLLPTAMTPAGIPGVPCRYGTGFCRRWRIPVACQPRHRVWPGIAPWS